MEAEDTTSSDAAPGREDIPIDETLVERALSQSPEERIDLLVRRARELLELRDGRQG